MDNDAKSPTNEKKKHPKVLLILTTIYGALYIILLLSFLLFENPDFNNINLEAIMVSLAFVVFFIGYYYSWKNELIAGLLFIFWWGIMWYLGLFVAERDKGAGVVMGVPMFIIAILFVVYWYRRDIKTTNK
jgi:membrane protease YdiL (CAAX protease family)